MICERCRDSGLRGQVLVSSPEGVAALPRLHGVMPDALLRRRPSAAGDRRGRHAAEGG